METKNTRVLIRLAFVSVLSLAFVYAADFSDVSERDILLAMYGLLLLLTMFVIASVLAKEDK